MKLGFHEITLKQGSFPEHLAAMSKAGWKHFELNLCAAQEFIESQGIEATRKIIDDHGLTCVATTGMALNAFKDDAARAADLESIKARGELMQALGCRPIVTGGAAPESLCRENYIEMLDRFAEHLYEVALAAAPFNVQLAIEVNWCALCRSFRSAAELVRRVNHTAVGVVWDPAHFYTTPSRLCDLDLLHGRILHAHLDDMNGTPLEVIDVNNDRVIPGKGVLPMREWTAKVISTGYEGYHCVELFGKELGEEDLETICRRCYEGCLEVWPDASS